MATSCMRRLDGVLAALRRYRSVRARCGRRPSSRPAVEWLERLGERRADAAERISVVFVAVEEAGLMELAQPLVENARRHAVAPRQECAGPVRAIVELPQDAERPPSAEQVHGGEERAPGLDPRTGLPGLGTRVVTSALPLCCVSNTETLACLVRCCFRNAQEESCALHPSSDRTSPPWRNSWTAMMPPGVPPIALSGTFARATCR